MNTLLIIAIVILALSIGIFIVTCSITKDNSTQAIVIFICSMLLFICGIFTLAESQKPTALDVYEGRTQIIFTDTKSGDINKTVTWNSTSEKYNNHAKGNL